MQLHVPRSVHPPSLYTLFSDQGARCFALKGDVAYLRRATGMTSRMLINRDHTTCCFVKPWVFILVQMDVTHGKE